jgi:anti-anti-sigma factor
MMLADVDFSERDDALVAQLIGEVDASNAVSIGSALADATPNRVLGVVLDLTGVSYMDSAGINMLYRLREGVRARGQTLTVVIPTGSPVNDALRLAGVDKHIQRAETIDEALSSLGPAEANSR